MPNIAPPPQRAQNGGMGPTKPRTARRSSDIPSLGGGAEVLATRANPHQNHLLDALPAGDYERLAPILRLCAQTGRCAL